jgi:hypothetical protein
MAEDWEKLAEDWKGHEVALVAEVDCTDSASESICEDFEVQGFPTLMYGDPHSPETYQGGRDYESLAAFAKENIGKPVCSVTKTEFCSDEQKAIIESLQKKSKEDLESIEAEVDKGLADAQTIYEAALEELNDQYEKIVNTFNDKLDEIRNETNYKWVQQVLVAMGDGTDSTGDEL